MIDRGHDLQVTRQALVLSISRGNVYYLPRSMSSADLALMRRITVSHARASIGRCLAFYNGHRPHSSLDRKTPDTAYFNALMPIPAAA